MISTADLAVFRQQRVSKFVKSLDGPHAWSWWVWRAADIHESQRVDILWFNNGRLFLCRFQGQFSESAIERGRSFSRFPRKPVAGKRESFLTWFVWTKKEQGAFLLALALFVMIKALQFSLFLQFFYSFLQFFHFRHIEQCHRQCCRHQRK
ncbi:hypothetical protein [Planococcus salinarum]|uniref:hypothetical protein n=1 Tax=Planococcus salinarum TaxID=622695 RepID=UPI001E5F3DF1|nr:hypothetical protein [Planococcus salinarum]